MKVPKKPDDVCWLWRGGKNAAGYGMFSHPALPSPMAAHRMAYTLAVGTIPDGLVICHRCDTPPCVNPKHLFAGTHAQNMKDYSEKYQSGRRPRIKKRRKPEALEETALMTQVPEHERVLFRQTYDTESSDKILSEIQADEARTLETMKNRKELRALNKAIKATDLENGEEDILEKLIPDLLAKIAKSVNGTKFKFKYRECEISIANKVQKKEGYVIFDVLGIDGFDHIEFIIRHTGLQRK